jgi:release factor glutamine methyltransferase
MAQTILAALQAATSKIISVSDSAQLDAEMLLAFVLEHSRSYLHAWPEKKLTEQQTQYFNQLIDRRACGEPVPYLIGHQEFWSLEFNVTCDTLIPRPETELLVELALKKITGKNKTIADMGTGSGAIALSIAHERPEWIIHATDQSDKALQVAKSNAEKLTIKNIHFHHGNWCQALPGILFDGIVSNPPYIAENDVHLKQNNLRYEPRSALASGMDGLDAIRQIILSANHFLMPGAYLMLEHGYDQATSVRFLMEQSGYHEIISYRDLSGIERVTMGVK